MSPSVNPMSEASEDVGRLLREIVKRAGASYASQMSPEITADAARAADIVATLAPIARASGSTVEWVAVNGRRVDVGATAGEREWRVALSIDSDGVHSAAAFEQPALFPGVPGGRAVIVNGPSSVGKSTVMDAVLDAASSPWVKFDELSFGVVASRFLIWRDRSPTLPRGFLAGITALALEGNQVILAGSGRESSVFDDLRSRVPTVDVGLDCPLDVRVERQSRRSDRWGGLTEGDDSQHDGWTYDIRFDTSETSAEEIALAILQRAIDIGRNARPEAG